MRLGRHAIAVVAVLGSALAAPAAHAAFGVTDDNFEATVLKSDMTTPETHAGAHPFVGITDFTFNTTGLGTPDGSVRNIRVDLPPGLISNPQATNHCTDAQFNSSSCPADSQVGTEEITAVALIGLATTIVKAPIYNMQTGNDKVSDFAFAVPLLAPRTDIVGGVRDTTDSGLFFTISNVANTAPVAGILRSKLSFCGVPSAAAHDAERGHTCTFNLGIPVCLGGPAAVTRTNTPFLSLPTACAGPQRTTLNVTSWSGATDSAISDTEVGGVPTGADGCDEVPFDPSISVTPGTTQAD